MADLSCALTVCIFLDRDVQVPHLERHFVDHSLTGHLCMVGASVGCESHHKRLSVREWCPIWSRRPACGKHDADGPCMSAFPHAQSPGAFAMFARAGRGAISQLRLPKTWQMFDMGLH